MGVKHSFEKIKQQLCFFFKNLMNMVMNMVMLEQFYEFLESVKS